MIFSQFLGKAGPPSFLQPRALWMLCHWSRAPPSPEQENLGDQTASISLPPLPTHLFSYSSHWPHCDVGSLSKFIFGAIFVYDNILYIVYYFGAALSARAPAAVLLS